MPDLTIYRHFDDFVVQKYHIDDLSPYFGDFWKIKIYIIFFTLDYTKLCNCYYFKLS